MDPPLRHIIISRLSFGGDVISELEMHEDMLSPWWVNVTVISVLGGLVVMMLAQIVRDRGLIPPPPRRHRIFSEHVTYSNYCYIILNFSSKTAPLRITVQRTDHLHR